MTRVLVLGGGFGGLFAARELRRRFGSGTEIEIISEENYFVFQPLLPEVAAGSITATHAVSPLRFLLEGVKVRKATIAEVDTDRRVVTVFQGVQRRPTEVSYDHLVVALGQKTDLSRTPGLTDHAMTMKTLDDARRLRTHMIEKLEHADITNMPEVKREALTFVVVGAGFSGIETAGELSEMIGRSLKYYPNIRPSEVRMVIVEFADRILREMPQKLADYALKHLEKRGIEVMLNTGVARATGTAMVTTTGERIGTRTIVATIGNAPSDVVKAMPLRLNRGKIEVERTMRAVGHENVWALGDCAMIPMKEGAEGPADFAPPTAQFAVREARALAENIAAVLREKAPKPFEYESQGALASLGAHRGVAQVWGVNITGFPAWLLWRAYYLGFVPGLWIKSRVLTNWILDALSPRSIVQVHNFRPSAVRFVHYLAGDRVFEAGTRADGVYAVIEGALQLVIDAPEHGGPTTRRIGPGEHVGDRMILGDTRRIGTVTALEDTKVLVMDREEFLRVANGVSAFRSHFREHIRSLYGIDWDPPNGGNPPA
ncbi:FAD-dependent oxidoreductase [Oceaniglobus roseus]|uniref:FAD-dependent oxidoreductase n=1 Tax=Oceaniglobus roseus TaxID=1737570 RepID=UPI000C7F1005|nr:FAD-dependent oxidoreductase [Kandeliimicrobium roseum]